FRRALLFLVSAFFLTSTCLGQGRIANVPTRRALERLQLEKHWMSVVPVGISEKVTRFNVADTHLFAQTSGGHLHAYDAETSQYQWGVRLSETNTNALRASVNSDMVFVTALKTLHALDRRTGRPVWNVELEGLPSAGPICDEETVAVGL